MAGIECMFTPFGTVLGVFTIIVLMRPEVKTMFGIVTAPPPQPCTRKPSASNALGTYAW